MTAHRCPECGAARTWTRRKLIAAAVRWDTEHGNPPRVTDWTAATVAHPSKRTVYMVFGSWPDFLLAAGFEPHRARWTREGVLQALFAWRFEHGKLPSSHQWTKAGEEHPCRYTVRALFGSWNAAVVAAGYEPAKPYRSIEGYQRQAGARTRLLAAAEARA